MSNNKPDATWHPNDGPPEPPRHSTTPLKPATPRGVDIFATLIAWVIVIAMGALIIGVAFVLGGLLFELILSIFA